MPTVRLPDGVDLAYEETGAGTSAPLLLLAPLGRDRSIWNLVVPRLADVRRCITFDYRGTGETPAVGPYTLTQFARDASQLADELGLAEYDLLGSSMGAAVAQELALADTARVRNLVLITPWGRTDENLRLLFEMLRVIAQHGTAEQLELAVEWFVFSPAFLNRDPEGLRSTVKQIVAAPGFPSADANVGHIDASIAHDALDRLGAVRARTLVVVGDEDRLTPAVYGEAVAKAIPNASLHRIAGTGASHGLALERLDELIEAVRAFLAPSGT